METTARPEITMQPVESSQIAAIGHHAGSNTLAIQFTAKNGPGSVYHYRNFTAEQFAAFAGAESIGSHFGKHIKPFSEKHPYQKIEATAAASADDRTRPQTCADEHLANARERANDERKAGLPAGSLHALIDDLDELEPTDEEITAMGADCGLTPGEWVIRLSKYVAARELVAA